MIEILIPTTSSAVAVATAQVAIARAGIEAMVTIMMDDNKDGAVRTLNRGLAEIENGRDVCLLNDDCLPITEDWLLKLHTVLLTTPEAGFVGASGACRTAPICFATGPTDNPPEEVHFHPSFCQLIRGWVLDDLGPFSEDFIHYGFDQDYQWRARDKGWKTYWHPGVWCEHRIGGWTEREPEWEDTRKAWKRHDEQMLNRKWSGA